MDLKDKLIAILKEYKERHQNLGPCDYVIFFSENEGDEVNHLLCYEAQLPAVIDFSNWYEPHMLVINPMGMPIYQY